MSARRHAAAGKDDFRRVIAPQPSGFPLPVVYVFVGLHESGALWHDFVMKDGARRRMLQGTGMRLPAGRLTGALLAVSAVTLAGGLVARQMQDETLAEWIWIAGTLPNAMALVMSSAGAAIGRQSGIDALSLLSIVVALIFGEFLVPAVVSLMLATGRALQNYARSRARREMTAQPEPRSQVANRLEAVQWRQVDVAEVRPGGRLMVRHVVLPVDGALTMPAELDESALTGESAMRQCVAGESIKSGAVNTGVALEMMSGATEAESTFAGIVRMVAAAAAQ